MAIVDESIFELDVRLPKQHLMKRFDVAHATVEVEADICADEITRGAATRA